MAQRVAGFLMALGIKPGDAVGIYMPMVPEVVATLFGCFKIGAVAVPVFSGFGASALASRLADAEAKVLITADGSRRRGKLIEIKKDADEAAGMLAGLEQVVVLKHMGNEIVWHHGRDIWFHEAMQSALPAVTKMDLPSEHPCTYLYTSGTTGEKVLFTLTAAPWLRLARNSVSHSTSESTMCFSGSRTSAG